MDAQETVDALAADVAQLPEPSMGHTSLQAALEERGVQVKYPLHALHCKAWHGISVGRSVGGDEAAEAAHGVKHLGMSQVSGQRAGPALTLRCGLTPGLRSRDDCCARDCSTGWTETSTCLPATPCRHMCWPAHGKMLATEEYELSHLSVNIHPSRGLHSHIDPTAALHADDRQHSLHGR